MKLRNPMEFVVTVQPHFSFFALNELNFGNRKYREERERDKESRRGKSKIED